MSVFYDTLTRTFRLDTPKTSYMMQVLEGGYLCHLYWGGKIDAASLGFLSRRHSGDEEAVKESAPYPGRLGIMPQEFPPEGTSDFRVSAVHISAGQEVAASDFRYKKHEIIPGKPPIEGLPATYAGEEEAATLAITLWDEWSQTEAILWYTVFEDVDAIVRRVTVVNRSTVPCTIERLFSACIDFPRDSHDVIYLHGGWADERNIERKPLPRAILSVQSGRGISSHEHNPFIALCDKETTESYGDVYGLSLVYSGSFAAVTEVDNQPAARVLIGLNPDTFSWSLQPGEKFDSPEAVLVYSSAGLNGMSREYHRLYRHNLCKSKWKTAQRPILINNWEATYFDFNKEKLLALVKESAEAGVELFVLDDGWFGQRDSDDSSLGDWVENTEKLGGTLSELSEAIHGLGMKFGLWFEPEMISPDSDLYRAHPDWCLHTGRRPRTTARNQLVLDMARDDVTEFVINAVSKVLEGGAVDYVKWDMNRSLTEVGASLPEQGNHGEMHHRYMLGVYKVIDALTSRFPDILFEGCAGGGGRFDPGMLHYMPQIWTSDNTDAVQRLKIQYGTSLVYPPCAMSAHVSASPNHQMNRSTPLTTRFHASLTGSFGYELNLCKMSTEEKQEISKQIEEYKGYRELLSNGVFYRLINPFEGNRCAWMTVSQDKSQALASYFVMLGDNKKLPLTLRLCGLDAGKRYKERATGAVYSGNVLMNVGLPLPALWGDFLSHTVYLEEV